MSRCDGRLAVIHVRSETPKHHAEDAVRILHRLRRQYSNQFDRTCDTVLRGTALLGRALHYFVPTGCFATDGGSGSPSQISFRGCPDLH
jgi:hypothetical protein